MENPTVLVCGPMLTKEFMKAPGKMANGKVTVCKCPLVTANMKGNGGGILNMVRVLSTTMMESATWAPGKAAGDMAEVCTSMPRATSNEMEIGQEINPAM